jgi:glycosyltransferase involved in cell wall biosynthesis/SAM-dependent methyltransferase
MRILFVAWRDLPHPRAGGSEVLVDELARRLHERGHDVTLLCGGPAGSHPYRAVSNGGTYTQYLATPFRYAARFRDVDLVVDTINGMPYFSPLWRHAPRLAMLTHVHTDQWARYFPRRIAAAARFVEGKGLPFVYRNTHFVTISPSTAQELRALGVDESRVHVMWLGANVEPAGATVARSPEPMFVALGRLAPNKRLDLLLDLWARVAPQTGGRLVIVGDGPERDRLEARTREDPALAGVVFEGKVSERRKAELLGQAWLLVHTAEREGWGLVIPEAGLCRTPALAFDVPGVKDAVEPGVSGVLAAGDDEFAAEWVALAADASRRAALGEQAAVRAARLSWDRTADEFLAAADAAIAAHAGRRRRRPAGTALFATATAADILGATTPRVRDDGELPPTPLPPGEPATEPGRGIARSVRLLSLFRNEATDPDTFYHYLARDTLRHVREYQDPAGGVAIDIGGGPGYIAEALKRAGAECTVVEYSADELRLHNRTPERAVQADGQALPLRDGCVRLVLSSNVLEHVPNWESMLSEMVRVLEPGRGLGYLTLTNWYSPWGGHETSPWHYLGGRRAVERYTRRYGRRPKNEFGVSLYRLHIAQVMRWFRERSDVEVCWVGPRYLPEWMRWIVRVPLVREVLTWNLVVVFRRRAGAARATRPEPAG